MKSSKWGALVLIPVLILSLAACDKTGQPGELPWLSGEFYDTTAMVLAEYHVWHGLPSHSVAFSSIPGNHRPYDSRDPEVVVRHIREAKARGISGFVVNWYGPKAGTANDEDREFMDLATAELFKQAEVLNFSVALLYDEGTVSSAESDPALYEARVKSDLSYAERYFASSAYLRINDRPALFFFPYGTVNPFLDWAAVRNHLSVPVTLMDKDPNPLEPEYDAQFDGFYAWVTATNGQWHPDGLEWGREYMEWYYSVMRSEAYAGKVTVGGVWPGFDDSFAPWSANRFMARAGNATHDQLLSMAETNNVNYILVGTWNDFEEGTDIEYGVKMLVYMEKTDPQLLIRSTPVLVVWDTDVESAALQVYRDGQLLYDQQHGPGTYLSLTPGNLYELKLWVPGSATPLSKWVKIRRNDPVPDVVPVEVD